MTQTLSGELADGQRKLVALALAGASSETMNPLRTQISNGPIGSFHEKREMKVSKFKRICVFCGSSQGKKSSYEDAAIELGKELERRYLFKEFPELASCGEHSKVLVAGCGNGSTTLAILRGKENILVFACDCSTEALERATEVIYASNVVSAKSRFRPFCCDFSTSRFP